MDNEPLVKGGQGRTCRDVTTETATFVACILLFAVIAAGAAVADALLSLFELLR